jgi:hypothetical protein
MRHHPRSSIIGVAEVRRGPLAVDGEVAPFRAELERWLTTWHSRTPGSDCSAPGMGQRTNGQAADQSKA